MEGKGGAWMCMSRSVERPLMQFSLSATAITTAAVSGSLRLASSAKLLPYNGQLCHASCFAAPRSQLKVFWAAVPKKK